MQKLDVVTYAIIGCWEGDIKVVALIAEEISNNGVIATATCDWNMHSGAVLRWFNIYLKRVRQVVLCSGHCFPNLQL